MHHAGTQVLPSVMSGKGTVSASAIAASNTICWMPPYPMMPVPHALTTEEVKEKEQLFIEAAVRAQRAGYDGVELHCTNGYLLHQFLSMWENKRTDEYGGSIYNRTRIVTNIIRGIKERCGKEFPVITRISIDDCVTGSNGLADAKAIAIIFEEAGVDAIDTGIGRGSLADPEFPAKAKAGLFEEIIHCTGCMQGCIGSVYAGQSICCLANPRTGREAEFEIFPSKTKKKVFVAGGGMEAAIVAAKRGLDVEIFEKSDELGGQLVLAGVAPNKQEFENLAGWQKYQIHKLGVKVHMNTELTTEIVVEQKPDAVVIASGAIYVKPPIKGVDNKNVVTAPEILDGSKLPGTKCVVIGGGHVGCEVTDHLCMHSREVSVVEMLPTIGDGDINFGLKMADFTQKGVKLFAGTRVLEITENNVVIENENGVQKLPADTVVIATGTKSVNALETELQGKAEKVITVGDAKKVRLVIDAIREGYEAALEI